MYTNKRKKTPQDRYALKISDPYFEQAIKELAMEDMRSVGAEVAWIVRKEYIARHPEATLEIETTEEL